MSSTDKHSPSVFYLWLMCVAMMVVMVQGEVRDKGEHHDRQVSKVPLRLQMLIHNMVIFDEQIEDEFEVCLYT